MVRTVCRSDTSVTFDAHAVQATASRLPIDWLRAADQHSSVGGASSTADSWSSRTIRISQCSFRRLQQTLNNQSRAEQPAVGHCFGQGAVKCTQSGVEASRRRQTASRVKLQRDVQEATRNSLLTFAPSLQAGGGWRAQRFGRLCKRRRRRVRAEGSSGGLTDGCASCQSAQELQRQEKSGLRIATGV